MTRILPRLPGFGPSASSILPEDAADPNRFGGVPCRLGIITYWTAHPIPS